MSKKKSVGIPLGLWVALILIFITVMLLIPRLSSRDGSTSALYVGLLVLLFGYLLSCIYTKDSVPWALARKPTAKDVGQVDRDGDGHQVIADGDAVLLPVTTNSAVSLSKLQTLLYFSVVIFAYVFVYTLRYVSTGISAPLPRIPVEVLALIGLSVGTTVGAQALSLRYQDENKVGEADKSDLIKNRDGNADLTKVQMLLWTLVSIIIYLSSFFQLANAGCYVHDYRVAIASSTVQPLTPAQMSLCKTTWNGYEGSPHTDNNRIEPTPSVESVLNNTQAIPVWQTLGPLLPKFDPMLLLLAGVVQGTYLAGRFVATRNKPKIDGVYRTTSAAGFLVRIIGTFEGIYSRPYITQSNDEAKLFNAMLEVTNADGQAFLVNLGDSATLNTTKPSTVLDSTVKDVKAGPTAIILTNLLDAGKYSFRISIDGVWSDTVTFDLA